MDKLKLAQENQLKEIYSIFRQYKEIFPHIRQDYLLRTIKANECVYDSDVVITFKRYKKKTRLGSYEAQRGDVIIHQIVNRNQGNGNAKTILNRFIKEKSSRLEFVSHPSVFDSNLEWTVPTPVHNDLILCVRENNQRAVDFYKRNGWKQVGTIIWDGGKLPGIVFRYGG